MTDKGPQGRRGQQKARQFAAGYLDCMERAKAGLSLATPTIAPIAYQEGWWKARREVGR